MITVLKHDLTGFKMDADLNVITVLAPAGAKVVFPVGDLGDHLPKARANRLLTLEILSQDGRLIDSSERSMFARHASPDTSTWRHDAGFYRVGHLTRAMGLDLLEDEDCGQGLHFCLSVEDLYRFMRSLFADDHPATVRCCAIALEGER